jgi:hypothetical protein
MAACKPELSFRDGLDFDLGACLVSLVPEWIWAIVDWWQAWGAWVIWGVVGLIALGALAKVKELAGWPGVFAVVTLGAYALGRWHGARDEFNPIEMFRAGDADADESPAGTRTKRPRGIPVR